MDDIYNFVVFSGVTLVNKNGDMCGKYYQLTNANCDFLCKPLTYIIQQMTLKFNEINVKWTQSYQRRGLVRQRLLAGVVQATQP